MVRSHRGAALAFLLLFSLAPRLAVAEGDPRLPPVVFESLAVAKARAETRQAVILLRLRDQVAPDVLERVARGSAVPVVAVELPLDLATEQVRAIRLRYDLLLRRETAMALAPDGALLAGRLPESEPMLQDALARCHDLLQGYLARRDALLAHASGAGVGDPSTIEFLMARCLYEDALQDLETYLDSHPDSAWARSHKARCHERLGQTAEAKVVLRRLIDDYAGHPDATAWRLRLDSLECTPFRDESERGSRARCVRPVSRTLEVTIRDGDIVAEEAIRLGILRMDLYADLHERVSHWEWLARYSLDHDAVIRARGLLAYMYSEADRGFARHQVKQLLEAYPDSEDGAELWDWADDLPPSGPGDQPLPTATWLDLDGQVLSVGKPHEATLHVRNPGAHARSVYVSIDVMGASVGLQGEAAREVHLPPNGDARLSFVVHPGGPGDFEVECWVGLTETMSPGVCLWSRATVVEQEVQEDDGR